MWLFLAIVLLLNFACSKDQPANNAETKHFVLKWNENQATTQEIEEAKRFAEEVYTKYLEYFGVENLPQEKTIINLGGDAFSENGGAPRIPFVNENGEIFLFRFETGYLGELPHEFAHVLRFYKGWSSDGFLEEGLAELMSSKLFPENVGFSLYGFSTTIAAGLLLNEDNLIPLQELKDKHFNLNLACLVQSYPLRADFFKFVLEEYGKEDFMNFIYAPDAGSYGSYEHIYGENFEALEELWLQNLQQRIDALGDTQSQLQAYQAKISSLQFYICKRGIDF